MALTGLRGLSGFGSASSRPTAQFPPLTPEEEESLVSQLMGTGMGAFQYAAETLDKPGAAVRGLIAGEPDQLLNLIPFSDTLGITDPTERHYGSDLLVDLGLRQRNDPDKWFEPGDIAGFAFDVATDPLSWINPLGALSKGGHVAQRAGIMDRLPGLAKKATGGIEPGKRAQRSAHTLRELVEEAKGKAVGQEAVDEINTGLRGAAEGLGVSLDEVMDQRLGGGIGFSAGPFGRPTAIGGAARDVGRYGSIMDKIGGAIKYGKFSPVRAGSAAFSRPVRGQFDPVVQKELRNMDRLQQSVGPGERMRQNQVRDTVDEAMQAGGVDPSDLDSTFAVRGYLEMGDNLAERAPDLAQRITPRMQEILDPLRQQQAEIWQSQIDLGYKSPDETLKSEWDNWFFHRLATGGTEADVARAQEIADLPLGTVQVERLLNDPLLTAKPEHRYTREALAERGFDGETIREAENIAERMRKEGTSLEDLGPQEQNLYQEYKRAERVGGYRMTVPEQNQVRDKLLEKGYSGDDLTDLEQAVRGLNEGTLTRSDLSNNQRTLLQQRQEALSDVRKQRGPEGVTKPLGETGRHARVAENVYGMDEQTFRNARDLSQAIKNTKHLANDNPAKFRDPRSLLRNTEGMNPEQIAELERQAANLRTYERAEKLAKWVHRHGFREEGDLLFGNHPIADHRSYMVSQRMNTEKANAVHDMFAQLGKPLREINTREGHVGLGAAFDKLGFKNIPRAIEKFTEKTKGRFGADADVYLPKDTVEELAELFKKDPFGKPKQVNKFLDRYDRWINNAFKMAVTAWPAFHFRNLTSGVIQNVISGAYNPAQAIRYSELARQFSLGNDAIKGLSQHKGIKRLFGENLTDAQATQKLREIVDAHDLRGSRFDEIVEEALLRESMPPDATPWERLSPDLMKKPGAGPVGFLTPWKTLGGIARQPGLKGKLGALDPGIEWPFIGRQNPGAAGLGTDVVPEGVPLKAGEQTETFLPSKAQRQAGRIVEDVSRVGALVGYLDQGMSLDQAIRRVKETQVDYRNLSEIDRNVMRRVFPFWTFLKGISTNTANEILSHPGGKLAQTIRASNRGREGGAYTPSYIGEGLSIPLGEDKYLARLGLMHETPFDMAAYQTRPGAEPGEAPRMDIFETLSRSLQKVGSATTPAFKTPAEIAFDKQLFTGREHKDLYPFPFKPDETLPSDYALLANALLGGSPTARAVSTGRKLVDERKSPLEKGLSVTTGLGLTDVYGGAERAKQLEASRRMQETLEQSPRIKEFSTLYSPSGMQESLTPTERALLRFQTTQRAKRKEAAMANQ